MDTLAEAGAMITHPGCGLCCGRAGGILTDGKNNHSGNYEVESDGTIVCSFTKCIDSFPPNGPTEIQGYTAKFVLNSDGTLTSPTGSNGTTNWGKNTTWTKVQ